MKFLSVNFVSQIVNRGINRKNGSSVEPDKVYELAITHGG